MATILIAALLSIPFRASASEGSDTLPTLKGNWAEQLIKTGFHINDPRINYPAFPRFCVNVYNWGNHLFNYYDSTYVVGTGKNWKLQLKNDNWGRTYFMQLRDRSTIHITSNNYDDPGIYLSFMAVSIGYTFNLNSMFGDHTDRHRFDFNFTCSRFAVNYWSQKIDGGARIRKFGRYEQGHRLNFKFHDIDVDDSHFDIYYVLNNKKYSRAASYCFSKYQMKSAGSWLIGFNYDRHNLRLDFNNLPADMLDALPTLQREYHFQSSDYCLLAGYAHNWVLSPKKWVANLTIMPSLGYKHTANEGNSEIDYRRMLSANLMGMGSIVFNHKALFVSMQVTFNGFLNTTKNLTFFNSTQHAVFISGIRF